jgi:hypothetical protein
MDTTFIAGWISAMIDGEGSVQFGAYTDGRNGKPHQNLCVVVAHNTDLSVIETAGRYLDQLGVRYSVGTSVRGGKRKPLHRISVCEQASIQKLAAVIRLTIPRKQQALLAILEYIGRPKPPWLNAETLADLYFNQGLTLRGLCDHFGLPRAYASYLSTILRRAGHTLRSPHRPRIAVNNSDTHRWCPSCQSAKPIDAFHKDRHCKKGCQGHCKDCRNSRRRSI